MRSGEPGPTYPRQERDWAKHVPAPSPGRFGALPLGELHAEGVCLYCGARGELQVELHRTVMAMTQAIAHVCVDTLACQRRRYTLRRIA